MLANVTVTKLRLMALGFRQSSNRIAAKKGIMMGAIKLFIYLITLLSFEHFFAVYCFAIGVESIK